MSVRKERASSVPLLMVGLGLVIMVAAVLWFVSSASSTVEDARGVAMPAAATPAQTAEVERVTLAEAKAAYDRNEAIFVDTRGEPYFSQGHIPGALSMTNSEIPDKIDELDPDAWVLTYCT